MNLQFMIDYTGLIDSNDSIKAFLILNKFWLIWFIHYFIHNIIKISAGVRSTIQNRKISKLWIIPIHLSPIIIILYWLYQLFFTTNDYNNSLTGLFISILFSNLIELFYTVTTNISYFNNNNVNIVLELVPIFYSLQYYNSHATNSTPFELDLFYISFNRLLIHFLELSNKRDWYLFIDSSINILILFIFFNDRDCFASKLMKIRVFPKIASILYCIVSQLLYVLNLSNNNRGNDIWSLLINQCQTYKDKSFQEFIMNLATSHAAKGSIKSFKYDIYGNQVHNVIDVSPCMISGYLNQYQISPLWKKYNRDESTNENGDKNTDIPFHYSLENAYFSLIILVQWTIFNIVQKLRHFKPHLVLSNLVSSMLSIYKRDSKNKGNTESISNKSKSKSKNERIKDLNKLVTNKNYSKFLLRTGSDHRYSNNPNLQDSLFLLPDFDSSEDFLPDVSHDYINKNDELYDTESWALSQEIDDEETLTLHEELWQILLSFKDDSNSQYCNRNTNEELMWQISMWSLLRHQLIENKRLTRSMYAKEFSKELISEIILEQRFQPDDDILNDPEEMELIDKTTDEINDIGDPLICPICCLNPRNVILWPCQCLTVCDDCRLELGHRAIKNCISCDKRVQGYTKVNFV